MQNVKHFINLTAGLEHLEHFDNPEINFIRIQSTHCEQQHWEKILSDLDNNFLMNLALGYDCVVWDCSSRRNRHGVSRALWQGLAWVRYVLNRIWFGNHIELERGMHHYFQKEYNKLSKPIKAKIRYYQKFLQIEMLNNLYYNSQNTYNDGNHKYYKNVVKKYLTNKKKCESLGNAWV